MYMRTPFFTIRTGILDYLRGGFPWPARSFKHMESISIYIYKHPLKYCVSYYLRGLVVWPALRIFKCRYRMQTHRNQQ